MLDTLLQGALAGRDHRMGAGSLNLMLSYAQEYGISPGTCLSGTGLTRDMAGDPEAVIEPEQELAVIASLVDHLGVPFRHGFDLGLRYHLTTFGPWGLGLMSSASANDAMIRAVRYLGATYTFIRCRLRFSLSGPRLVLTINHLPEGLREFVVARDLGSMLAIHNDLLPAHPLGVSRIALELPRCSGMEWVEEQLGVTIEAGHSHSEIVIDPRILTQALRWGNEVTARQCENDCEQLLERRALIACPVRQARMLLMDSDLPLPGPEALAQRLNVSERHLRRRLNQAGTGWRQLVEEVLEHRARNKLASGRYSVQEVASELGYAETASFSHAFKRWTGQSPVRFLG